MIMNPIFYCLLCLCTYVLSDDTPTCKKIDSDIEYCSKNIIDINEVFNKYTNEYELDREHYTIRYDPPLYILEPIIERNSLGGGRTFKINAVTGELVEAIFTE